MSKIIEISVDCGNWGKIKAIRPIPIGDNPYGVLSVFLGTYIEEYFNIIENNLLVDALNGNYIPFIRSLGAHPHLISKRITDDFLCDGYTSKSCKIRTKNCKPGVKAPVCYHLSRFDENISCSVFNSIRDGVYILIVMNETSGKKLIGVRSAT